VAGYAIGIGVAPVLRLPVKRHNQAVAAAFRDIASQLEVVVEGGTRLRVRETGALVTTDFDTDVKTSAVAALEGVEIVATWTGPEYYWLYARLDRQRAEAGRRAREQGRARELQSLIQRLQAADTEPAQALRAGVDALVLMDADRNSRTPALRADVVSHLQRATSALQLEPSVSTTAAGTAMTVTARVDGEPAAGIPLRPSADGTSTPHSVVWTDARGAAVLPPPYDPGVTTACVDVAALQRHGSATSLAAVAGPCTSWRVSSPRREAVLTGVAAALRPAVTSVLAEHGVDVVPEVVPLRIDAQARATMGSQVAGLCFAFVDVTVQVIDGEETLYSNSAPRTKGAGSDCAEAVLTALRHPQTRLGEAAVRGRKVHITAAPRRRVRFTTLNGRI
jgi:hypothetical protein